MRPRAPRLVALLLAVASVFTTACGKDNPTAPTPTPTPTPTSTPAPSPPACSYTVGGIPAEALGAGASELALSVTTSAGCAWSAASSASFIRIVGESTGAGNGNVALAVEANAGAARDGALLVAGRSITIQQQAAAAGPPAPEPCAFAVSPPATTVASAGGDVVVNVTVTSGAACAWTAASNDTFVTIKQGATGTGNGQVTIGVAANSSAARVGSATVAGQAVVIAQDGLQPGPAPCLFALTPAHAVVSARAGTVAFNITQTQGSGCAWTATSQASFVTVTGGSSGTGNGIVTLSFTENTGSGRQGTVIAGGQVFTVIQATDCLLNLSPTFGSAPAQGGTVTINVSFLAGTTCAWTARSNASFVTIAGPASGTGAGTLTLTVAPNTGLGRQTTVDVSSAPYFYAVNISQAAAGPGPNAVAVLSYQSDVGDSIGTGQSNRFTLTSSQFTAVMDGAQSEMQFQMLWNGSTAWNVALEGPSGQPLTPGLYLQAAAWPTQPFNQPGLRVSGDGHSCSPLTGRFLVAEAVYGPNQSIQRFHARFEQHCGGFSPGIRGEIWIDAQGSTTPPPIAGLPPGPATPTTFYSFQSDPGDQIGQGTSGSYTIASASFGGSDNGGRARVTALVRELTGPLFRWTFAFESGGGSLQPGIYNVTGTTGSPRFDIGRFGSTACSSATGSFQIFEILFGPQGELERFHVKFEYRCNGNPSAALRGELYLVANPWK